MSELGIPVNIEKSEISSYLDSFILNVFGMGMYAVIYFSTMYMYRNVSFALTDGILIWRCFFVWSRSFRAISVPLLLIIAEIGLFFAEAVFQAIYGHVTANVAGLDTLSTIISAALFTTFATSVITTVLIAYKIYSASKECVSERRFKRIINIVVQSGAIYSLSLLVCAIALVLPGGDNPLNTRLEAMQSDAAAVVNVIGGVATTVLVARVCMLPTNITFPSTSLHLSGLQFNTRSTHHADTLEVFEASHPVDVDRNPVVEGLLVEGKVESTVRYTIL